MPRPLYFLVGASAVGKTRLALEWAQSNAAEIVSCDALLVYRGMDIGTAKPTVEEQRVVRHHLIDVLPAYQEFSVATYMRMAMDAVQEIRERGHAVLVCGGSGFYLKSFFAPVIDDIEISGSIRERVRNLFETKALAGLREELQRLNPGGVGALDLSNPRRVENALARCLASGSTLNVLQSRFEKQRSPFQEFDKRVCLLERSRQDLRVRVITRTRGMLANGLLGEVSRLVDQGIECNPSAASAIGYREAIACIRQSRDLTTLESSMVRNTMRFIKKQATWFRHQIPVDQRLHLEPGETGEASQLFI